MNSLTPKSLTDTLMSKTHTQHGYIATKRLYRLDRNTRCFRGPRPGGNNQILRFFFSQCIYRKLVIANHFNLLIQFTKILNQVIGKRIVIIDH